MAGKTDPQIIREGFSVHGIAGGDGHLAAVLSSYVRHLNTEMGNDRKHLKPGIKTLLSKLSAIPEVHLGLLTGNIEEGARIKLDAMGIIDYFSTGAFGSDDEDRNRLLPVAAAKFSKITGIRLSYEDCIVIGDTPRDVECAKPYGAMAVAVATGPYDIISLSRTGADFVLGDLSDTGFVVSLLTNGLSPSSSHLT